jgi:glycosyltransferase involved in cell wall biosynthesis
VARRALGLDPTRRYVTVIARFHPVKDHRTLLEAFRMVADQCSDVNLLLVGDGPLRPELEALTDTLGLRERAHFLGVRHDVAEILQASDVFALTSVSEAASITLLEAMASRLPVVVTRVGGNPEIVREGTDGFLVPRGDARAVAQALMRVLANAELSAAMGAAGAERVRSRYQLDDTINRYYELYAKSGRPSGHIEAA